MLDEASRVEAPSAPRLHRRVRLGMRQRANWAQLARFASVGATGYVVNLAVFALAVHALDFDYRIAAALAFLVAVTNNFVLNRRWTFRAGHGRRRFQAPRFLLVSLAAFGVNLLVLELLVAVAGLPEVPSQAMAVVVATPLNFIGNKLWSFRA